MDLLYPEANEIPGSDVSRLRDMLANAWQSREPDVDLRQGNLNDLVLHPQALLTAIQEAAVLNAISSLSLSSILADAATADSSAVDRLLGNFGLVRRTGSRATGSITIVVSTLKSVIVPAGTKFTCGGVIFLANATFTARTNEASVLGVNDRFLTAVSGGYSFNIDVTAENVGSSGNVSQGTSATAAISIANLVRAHAAASFSGGVDQETNAQLVARQQQGLAAKIWGGKANILAATNDAVRLVAASLVGAGSQEMQRDKRAAWPVGTGLRTDFWIRTSSAIETTVISKTATLVSKVGAVGTWQFSLSRDDVPGFFEVKKVLLPTADQTTAGFAPTSLVRGKDVGSDLWAPEMSVAIDAAFSRYQTGVCQFADTTTDATSLVVNTATATYSVHVTSQPAIKDVQDFWSSVDRRPPAGDMLIRAVIPCEVTVSAVFTYTAGASYDAAAVKAAIAAAVNSIDFTGSVPASLISQAIYASLPATVGVSSVSLTGRLLKPDGTVTSLSSSTALTITNDYANMVSGKTVAFFLQTTGITLSATAV
jgi:uncharacterized phage protein gp47/JayE